MAEANGKAPRLVQHGSKGGGEMTLGNLESFAAGCLVAVPEPTELYGRRDASDGEDSSLDDMARECVGYSGVRNEKGVPAHQEVVNDEAGKRTGERAVAERTRHET